jgi:AcrR family transcriptional regulator
MIPPCTTDNVPKVGRYSLVLPLTNFTASTLVLTTLSSPSDRRLMNEETPQRRRYDSPLRRQRAAETRQRIVTAGAELLHEYPTWNWRELTVRAVAKRSGVNERTVYRHFPSERELRDAVMHRLEQEANVDLTGMHLEDIADITRKILEYTSSFPVAQRTVSDPTIAAANQRQREALLAAVTTATNRWSSVDRKVTAAMFDVLWAVVNYERLVTVWEIEPNDAIRGIIWVIHLIQRAIVEDGRPIPTGKPAMLADRSSKHGDPPVERSRTRKGDGRRPMKSG